MPSAPGRGRRTPPRSSGDEQRRENGASETLPQERSSGRLSPLRRSTPPASRRTQAGQNRAWQAWPFPFFPDAFDFGSEGGEIVVAPRALSDEGGHQLRHRAAEKRVDELLKGGALRDGRRHRGRIEIAQSVLLMFEQTLLLEPGEHHAHRGVAGRIRQTGPDLLGRGTMPRAKSAFMISRSRRVSRSCVILAMN